MLLPDRFGHIEGKSSFGRRTARAAGSDRQLEAERRGRPDRRPAQPELGSEPSLSDVDADAGEEDLGTSREPKVRGRAPIFENGQRSIASLISDIERGVIALPDLQRPFVWEDTKGRAPTQFAVRGVSGR